MKLYRGCRRQNGRVDVVVTTAEREYPLNAVYRVKGKKPLEYDWGRPSAGSRTLSVHLLADALANDLAAGFLSAAFRETFIYTLTANPWAFSQQEIWRWAIDELTSRNETLIIAAKGRAGTCPSEN